MLTKVLRQKECIRTDDGRIQSSAFCRRRDNILSAFARTILERLSLMSTVTADGKKKKKKIKLLLRPFKMKYICMIKLE